MASKGSKKVENEKVFRYVVPTGLRVLESERGRSMNVYSCVKRSAGLQPLEVNGTFWTNMAPPTAGSDHPKNMYCLTCRVSHPLVLLLDAFEQGILPMNANEGDAAVAIDVAALVAYQVNWLRTPKLQSVDRERKAS
jgi:hypothetical protein